MDFGQKVVLFIGLCAVGFVLLNTHKEDLKRLDTVLFVIISALGLIAYLGLKQRSFIGFYVPISIAVLLFPLLFAKEIFGRTETLEEEPPEEPKEEPQEEPPIEEPTQPAFMTQMESVRTSHSLVLSSTGHGKTQLLQSLIYWDLQQANTIIVMDSQEDMITKILALNIPKERFVYIDPTDIDYPLAVSLFDIGQDRFEKMHALERESQINGAIELLTYALSSLLDTDMTQKQEVAFRFVIRLLIHIPNANIHTLREIFTVGGFDKYQQYTKNLSESGQAFFRHEFNSKPFEETKQQVIRRLYGILENQTLERIFSTPKTKLNLFEELNDGTKIILINTAKSLLKEEGSKLVGRFFVSLIMQAVMERATLPESKRQRTYFYIDEAAPYLDKNITTILETARKYNLGLTLSFQSLGQIPPNIEHSIITNTAIKMTGYISGKDARALAEDMHTKHENLLNPQKLVFNSYVRGQELQKVQAVGGFIESMEQRTDWKELKEMTREKYCNHYTENKKEEIPEEDIQPL